MHHERRASGPHGEVSSASAVVPNTADAVAVSTAAASPRPGISLTIRLQQTGEPVRQAPGARTDDHQVDVVQ